MAWHNNAAKEWGALLAWAINPSDVSFKPKLNRRTVKEYWNRAGVRVATVE